MSVFRSRLIDTYRRKARAASYAIMPLSRLARFIPLGRLLGPEFRRTARELKETESWSFEALQDLRRERLRAVLQSAGRDVPYYRELFPECGVDPQATDIDAELAKLPLLRKQTIRAQGLARFTSERYRDIDLIDDFTGGTTGSEPMKIRLDRAVTHQREMAYIYHMFDRVGVHFGDPHVQIKIDSPRGWKSYEPLSNKLLLSQSLMDENTLDDYVRMIEKHQPTYINALASTAYRLVQLLEKQDREVEVDLKAVLLGSEMVHAHQRRAIEQKLNTRVFSWYGHVERLILAGEGRHDASAYYAFPQYGSLEIVDEKGERIDEPDVVGQLVGTGFNNDAMPLIRYATGDYGAWAERGEHSDLPYPAIHMIEGREQEFACTADGRLFSVVPMLFQVHDDFWVRIEDIQFYQPRPGQLVANIVPATGHDASDVVDRAMRSLRPNINPDLELTVSLVDRDDIVITGRGKKRLLIQEERT